MRLLVVFVLLGCALVRPAVAAPGAPSEPASAALPVVAVEGLVLEDLERFAGRAAVGLLVPGAGPETSEALARAAVERGEARNSLRGGFPTSPRRLRVRSAQAVPAGPAIVLGLPSGGRQPNDRRYPIAVVAPGYRGLLTSPSTRIAGLVSAVDVAPTARGEEGALGSTPDAGAAATLRGLDARISDNGAARQAASIAAAAIVSLLALVLPRAAALGIAAALLANLVLGIAGVSDPLVTVPVIAGSVLGGTVALRLPTLAIGFLLAATVAAYLVAMGVDDSWVALSPLGPSQNARFYGLSNLLETMLLAPALAAAAILERRFGPVAFAAVAAVSLVTVAGSRFGADGGGAIVLAVGFGVLAALLAGGGRRAVALGAAGAGAVVALLALDAALGPATHVGETVRGGPLEVARDLADRISLSWRRATSSAATALVVTAGIAALALLAARLRRLPRDSAALPLAFAAAIGVSLVVNDSPVDVTIWGVAGLLALGAGRGRLSASRGTTRRVARLVLFALAAVGLLAAPLDAGGARTATDACGVPDGGPLWIDYAGHDAPVPQKPGLVLAYSSGTEIPAKARAAGAGTIFFDLNFNNRVGTPTRPADPATMVERADRAYEYAVTITGCATPWIAENELFGAQTPTPWTPTTAQYRANVLTYLRRLAERGARPFVTIANPPYTGDEAAQWWRDVASAAVLVRQVFFTSPNPRGLHAQGPVLASRSMRRGMRAIVRRFTEIGIPASRVALELQFHSAPGTGGREGLQPAWKWFEIVKLEALAARQVTRELGTHSIWSWGWATFSQAGADPDKAASVCVYLWTRDGRLCDGPAAAGPRFDASRETGQIDLPPGVYCVFPDATIRTSEIAALTPALGDPSFAASVLLERLVLRRLVDIDPHSALLAERAFMAERFGRSETAYLRVLARARLSRHAMRAVLADRLRRDVISDRFSPAPPSPAAVEEFHRTYAAFLVREVLLKEPAGWLGNRRRGFALETFAPPALFTLRRARRIETPSGRLHVRPLAEAHALGELSVADARPTIVAALRQLARGAIYDGWLRTAERDALTAARCVRDDLPEPAVVDVLAALGG